MDAAIQAAIAAAAAEQPMPVAAAIPAIVPGRTLLVDGDYLAYYCGGNDDTPAGESKNQARDRIVKMKELSGSEHVVVHLTDPGATKAHRFVIATVKPYQGNRGPGRKPKNWEFLRDWMQSGGNGLFKVKTWGDREADDGATYHAMVLGPERAVLSCADKDWRMSPGWHIDWKTWLMTYMPPGAFRIEGADGHMHGEAFFWWQLLRGDGADNIPGLPYYVNTKGTRKQIGEKTADDFIARVDNHWDAFKLVGALYRTCYGNDWQDRLAEQMALLWMRRDKTAEIDDCLSWLDPQIIPYMQPAFDRIKARVEQQYKEVQAYVSE